METLAHSSYCHKNSCSTVLWGSLSQNNSTSAPNMGQYSKEAAKDNIAIDKPEKWADRNITKFKKGKPKVLFQERNTTRQAPEHTGGHSIWAGKLLPGKALEVLESTKVTISQNMHSSGILSCIESAASRPREGILLLCSALLSTSRAGSRLGLLSSEESSEGL